MALFFLACGTPRLTCCTGLVQVRTVLNLAHSAEAHFDYQRHAEALAGEAARRAFSFTSQVLSSQQIFPASVVGCRVMAVLRGG